MKKKYEKLTFKDQFIFGKVTKDKDLAKQLIEALLNEKIDIFDDPQVEKQINETKDGKSVRLDVYIRDTQDRIFDTEMQNKSRNKKVNISLPRRSRFYHSIIDSETLESGEDYNDLKDAYVIFICTYDPFGKGKYKYTFEKRCKEIEDFPLEDGAVTIFFNCKGDIGEAPKATAALLEYVKSGKVSDDTTANIEKAVKAARYNKEWRTEYMRRSLFELDARREGIAVGEELGEKRGKVKLLIAMVKDGEVEILSAAKRLGISEEEFLELMEQE